MRSLARLHSRSSGLGSCRSLVGVGGTFPVRHKLFPRTPATSPLVIKRRYGTTFAGPAGSTTRLSLRSGIRPSFWLQRGRTIGPFFVDWNEWPAFRHRRKRAPELWASRKPPGEHWHRHSSRAGPTSIAMSLLHARDGASE